MQNLRKTNETGRSMVEMLGVLAIVGVLSVGGVYGYGVAMKKHKANELLHQASMLATTISAQIQSKGELPQSIEDFGNSTYGTFNIPTKVNDEQFEMEITGMDSTVCEQMEKMAGGMVRQAECSGTTLTLTYNNNLSSEKVAADYKTESDCDEAGKTWCAGKGSSGACSNSTDCCAGYDSQCCDSETGDISSIDSCEVPGGELSFCSLGKCVKLDEKKCTDYENNSDCGGKGSGYYCQFNSKNAYDRGEGICTAINGGTEIDSRWVGPKLDWWSANSWCVGKGASGLVTHETAVNFFSCTLGSNCNRTQLGSLIDYQNYWVRRQEPGLYCFIMMDGDWPGYYCVSGVDIMYAWCENENAKKIPVCDSDATEIGDFCFYDLKLNWSDARDKCGGIEAMVSLNDVGCSSEAYASCNLTESGLESIGFWTSDCYQETCDNNTTSDDWSRGAIYVSDGSTAAEGRPAAPVGALCKKDF